MRRILVFQHVAYEILGTLNPCLRRAGFRIHYVNFGRTPTARPSLTGYDGLVILGGPMCLRDHAAHPHLAYEMTIIREAIARELPMLVICLGAQLIAVALGATLDANPGREIGWCDLHVTPEGTLDPCFAHFRAEEKVFQWHGDAFALPTGAVPLATAPTCHYQAFRYRRTVYAFQFHLEVDRELIARWLDVPRHRDELSALHGTLTAETIRRDTAFYLERSTALSHQTFAGFTALFPAPAKRAHLPSR